MREGISEEEVLPPDSRQKFYGVGRYVDRQSAG